MYCVMVRENCPLLLSRLPSKYSFLLFLLCLYLSAMSVSSKKLTYEKWCGRECGDYPAERAVCGTNNVTFPSRCHMFHYSCNTHILIQVAYKGHCRELTSCQLEQIRRKQQQQLAKKKPQQVTGGGSMIIHIPRCYQKSGNYFPKQCANGYCWCVDSLTGAFVTGTSEREDTFRHNCHATSNAQDVSASDTEEKEEEQEDGNDSSSSDCSGEEKKKFTKSINALIRKDMQLLEREGSSASSSSSDQRVSPVQRLFFDLDINQDEALQKKEIHEYRRYAKLMVPEKVCARTMQLHCDLDGSGVLEYSEWLMCVEPNEMSQVFKTLDTEDSSQRGDFSNPTEGGQLLFPIPDDTSGSLYNPPPVTVNPDEDCFTRRGKQILGKIYPLPNCELDGKYTSIQCSEVFADRICWCVDQDTGLALRDRLGRLRTGRNQTDLNCKTSKRFSPRSQECVGESLETFETLFLKALTAHLNAQSTDGSEIPTNNQTFWTKSFNLFDSSPLDSFLERSETIWIVNLAESTLKTGKMCAETLIERCDLNNDSKLSQYEWNACFNHGNPMLPIA